jgi:hypothetical protein
MTPAAPVFIAEVSPEMLVPIYQTIWRHIPENCTFDEPIILNITCTSFF